MNKDRKIVFMGTPDFAVYQLEGLLKNNYNVVGVVTSCDKPAGRGQKLSESAVKMFAKENNLKILQPQSLKSEEFLSELKMLNADVFVVVAFRMLPKEVWQMPKYGTFNLHASLLPAYRGAAPINWAIISGEKTTGLTTFLINQEIDKGEIILQKEVEIQQDEIFSSLYTRLAKQGSELIKKTLDIIFDDNIKQKSSPQKENIALSAAPKLTSENITIDWNKTAVDIHNKIRGLADYPSARSVLNGHSIKIFRSKLTDIDINGEKGHFFVQDKRLFVNSSDYVLEILELQLEGKKRMSSKDFLNGFKL